MKIVVVVNNHNSLGTLEFCARLKHFDPAISVMAACSALTARRDKAVFARLSVPAFVVTPGVTVAPKVPEAPATQVPATVPAPPQPQSALRCLIPHLPFYAWAREQVIHARMRACQKKVLALFETEKPDIVMSLSDRSHDYVEAATLWAARRNGTPIVIPFISHYDIDAALVYRRLPDGRMDPELRPFWPPSPYKWLTWLRLRGQMHKGIFFQPTFQLNANRRAGTLSAYPWWVGNGLSDIVCVDSPHTAEKFIQHRVNPAKIAITGHLSYDRVFASHRNREPVRESIFRKYGFTPGRELLVFSMPQYAEQGYMDWKRHWAEIEAIMAPIAAAGRNLLISLHPRSDRRQYDYLQEKFGCRFADEPLSDIIGAADLFLASNSSTFTWATLCGIPAIAVRSPIHLLFDFLETVREVYDPARITAEIEALLGADKLSFARDWKTLSRDQVFDGRFNERFLALLRGARPRP